MSKDEVLRKLLGYIGGDPEQDKVFAEACLMIMGKPEEEVPKAEPKKEKKPRKGKPFDTGKLKALHDAGWSVPKIADEMGVSDQTIYNKLKQIEEE